MALESPVCVGVISRLPAAELNTAAFNILMSIALFMESSIIDLLSTSTTLAKNPKDFALLSRFVWALVIGTGVLHALVVLTPLYYVITQHVMGVPLEVAQKARLGLALMVTWAPAIGWRRYRQGLLIRFHRTRMVGFGTAVRVSTVTLVNLVLYFATKLPGVMIVAIALCSAVLAEAIFAQFSSRDAVREHLSDSADSVLREAGQGSLVRDGHATGHITDDVAGDPMDLANACSPLDFPNVREVEFEKSRNSPQREGLTLKRLIAFHLPLTMTTMVALSGGPIVSAFLSKAPNPVLSLASWQVAFSLLWLFRTITFALPEVVITLYKDDQSAKKLRSFCIRVGLLTSGVALAASLLRVDVWFFEHIFSCTSETANLAHLAFFAAAPLGLVNAMQSYVRGMLTANHMNVARFTAVIVGLVTLIGGLSLGLLTPWRGVLSGAVALNVSLVAELAVLAWCWHFGRVNRGLVAAAADR